MHVCRVAGQQDPSLAVGCGLTGRVAEPGDEGRTVDPVIGPIDCDKPLAEIVESRFARGSDAFLGQHDPHPSALLVDDLAVADLILDLAQGIGAVGVAADAQGWLLGHLDLGDQGARRRVPPGELDAGGFAYQAASPVAPNEVFRT